MSESNALPASLSRLRERAGVRAAALRQQRTDAESVLWHRLRNRQLLGLKFRRQHPIGPYFADFAWVERKLVVELDGGQHVDAAAYDERRAQVMQAHGFETLRFWNHEVLKETDSVLEAILRRAEALTPTLSRKREREQSGPAGSHTSALTPTLSRKREREQDMQADVQPANERKPR